MNKQRTFGLSSVAAVLFACGGSVHWNDSCGCVQGSDWVRGMLAQELRLSDLPHSPSAAPIPVAQQVESFLRRADKNMNTLQKLRSIGPLSNAGCYENIDGAHRCVYWLWENGSKRRGIQVDIVGSIARGYFVETTVAQNAS